MIPAPQQPGLAVFDLDGTLTRRDTMWVFIRYTHGAVRFFWGLFCNMPWILCMFAGLYDRQRAKERLLAHYYRGWRRDRWEDAGRRFAQEKAESLWRQELRERLRRHQEAGDTCVIVTASLEIWAQPLAQVLNCPLIGTRPAYTDGKFAGYFEGKNCYGEEKIARLMAAGLAEIQPRSAYGDSSGDAALFEWADTAWRVEKDGLRLLKALS